VTLQAQYILATRETEWEMIPAALHNGLGILAWSPLASGFLTCKYARGEKRSPGTRAGQDRAPYLYTSSNYETSDRTWNAVDAIGQVAKETGLSPAQVALSWVTSRPGVVSAIVGALNIQQLAGSLAAVGLRLEAHAMAHSTPRATRTRRPIPTARSAQPSATGSRMAPRPSASWRRPTPSLGPRELTRPSRHADKVIGGTA
jgi:aryl-alcohol dehydrogenase (NADP+)